MTGRGAEPHGDDTLRVDKPSRATQRGLVEAVTRRYPDPGDHMPFLRALLAPMRPAVAPHGSTNSLAWQAARRKWLDRVRAWVADQGRVLASRNVSADDQRAYVQATGDRFQPPEGER